jgi:hypothetical protein
LFAGVSYDENVGLTAKYGVLAGYYVEKIKLLTKEAKAR